MLEEIFLGWPIRRYPYAAARAKEHSRLTLLKAVRKPQTYQSRASDTATQAIASKTREVVREVMCSVCAKARRAPGVGGGR